MSCFDSMVQIIWSDDISPMFSWMKGRLLFYRPQEGEQSIHFLVRCKPIKEATSTQITMFEMNAVHYCQLLRSAKPYGNKRRDMPITDVIFLHENVRPHTAVLKRVTLEEMGWNILENPPYSPELSSCGNFLFAPMK
ncbi:hypothetical protein J6590_074320 [Homalodisca vitripennis]|nr:hypothetical protein J6590_074320 [Homalodisca vitripennis]